MDKSAAFTNLKLNKVKDINYTNFDANSINYHYMITYFKYKYDNIYVLEYELVYLADDKDYTVMVDYLDPAIRKNFDVSEECKKSFNKCKNDVNIRFIVLYFGIFYTGKSGTISHANCIIYDKFYETCEIFEPYGSNHSDVAFNIEFMYSVVKVALLKLFNVSNVYLPDDYCPYNSFQRLAKNNILTNFSSSGFCLAWSIWYVDAKLSNFNNNRTQDSGELVRKLIQAIDANYFNDFIGNYSSFISYISYVMNYCSTNACDMSNILFTVVLQFFDLIDIDIIIFGNCSPNAKIYLKKIINNC